MSEDFHCELDDHIAESMKDPDFAAAFKAAAERFEASVAFTCPRGCCEERLIPGDGDWQTGVGPVDCPHRDDDAATIRATWRV